MVRSMILNEASLQQVSIHQLRTLCAHRRLRHDLHSCRMIAENSHLMAMLSNHHLSGVGNSTSQASSLTKSLGVRTQPIVTSTPSDAIPKYSIPSVRTIPLAI